MTVSNSHYILTSLPDAQGLLAKFKTMFVGKFKDDLPSICEWIVTYTLLKNSFICPELNCYYMYDSDQGIYKQLTKELYKKRIYEIFSILGRKLTYTQVNSILKQLELLIYISPTNLERQKTYVWFSNGILNIITGVSYTPTLFVTSKRNLAYNFNLKEARETLIASTSKNTLKITNPLKNWIESSIVPGEGSYLGYSANLNVEKIKG